MRPNRRKLIGKIRFLLTKLTQELKEVIGEDKDDLESISAEDLRMDFDEYLESDIIELEDIIEEIEEINYKLYTILR
mgnify:CR=1 FL=1